MADDYIDPSQVLPPPSGPSSSGQRTPGAYVDPSEVIAPGASPSDILADRISTSGSAYAEGLKSLARMVREASSIGEAPYSLINPSASEFLDRALGRPSLLEKGVAAAGTGAGTGMLTRSIGPVRGALSGALGEAGGEVGGHIAQNFGMPEAVGSVPGSILAGAPTLIPGGGTRARIFTEAMKGLSPEQQSAMIALQRLGAQEGVSLRPSQLSATGTAGLRNLDADVLSTSAGKGGIEASIAQQPSQTDTYIQGLLKLIPGSTPTRDTIRANQIERSIESTLQTPREQAQSAAAPLYEALRQQRPQLSVDQRFGIANDLSDLNDKLALLERSQSGRAVSGAERVATNPTMIVGPGGQPFRWAEGDVMKLDSYVKELQKRVTALNRPEVSGAEAAQAAGLQGALDSIKSRLLEASPLLKSAKDVYGTTRSNFDDIIRGTNLAQAAPRSSVPPGPYKPSARWEQFQPILEQGSPDDVRRASAELTRQDPTAFRDVALNWFQREYDKAFSAGASPQSGAQFANALKSNPNLDAILEEAARSKGSQAAVDPAAYATGFKKALDILQASGRPTAQAGASDMLNIAQSDPATIAARLTIGSGLTKSAALIRRVTNFTQAAQYRKLYATLEDPDSMAKIAELANKPTISPRTASMLSSIVGGTVSLEPQRSQQGVE